MHAPSSKRKPAAAEDQDFSALVRQAEAPVDDRYPSRQVGEVAVVARQEPVVHGDLGRMPAEVPVGRAALESFENDGCMVIRQLIDRAAVDELLAEADDLAARLVAEGREEAVLEPGSGSVRSVFAVHWLSERFRRLAASPALVALARFVLDDEVYIHQSRINYKPAFHGRPFYWHSDFETWHSEDGMPAMRALSVSVGLTRNSAQNGPVMLVPGSHRVFVGCAGETPRDHYRESLRRQQIGTPSDAALQRLIDRGGIVVPEIGPGDALVFDCNVMHGSNSNLSNLPRTNVFLVYNAMSNRLRAPFAAPGPRPEYIGAREHVAPLQPDGIGRELLES